MTTLAMGAAMRRCSNWIESRAGWVPDGRMAVTFVTIGVGTIAGWDGHTHVRNGACDEWRQGMIIDRTETINGWHLLCPNPYAREDIET